MDIGRLFEAPPATFLMGYILGAVLSWFAALDWMGRFSRKRPRKFRKAVR